MCVVGKKREKILGSMQAGKSKKNMDRSGICISVSLVYLFYCSKE